MTDPARTPRGAGVSQPDAAQKDTAQAGALRDHTPQANNISGDRTALLPASPPDHAANGLVGEIRQCRLCASRFAATRTAHTPRPVPWFQHEARILLAGQAPGARVHELGRPFDDRSGDRLRDWLGVDRATFYDLRRIASVPMAFCFPGYNAQGSDLPPPRTCAETWHDRVMRQLPNLRLRIVIGAYAQRWHLGVKAPMTDVVRGFQDHLPSAIALPHPSWRNTGWLRKNPWFETELLPVLRAKVKEALND